MALIFGTNEQRPVESTDHLGVYPGSRESGWWIGNQKGGYLWKDGLIHYFCDISQGYWKNPGEALSYVKFVMNNLSINPADLAEELSQLEDE